MASADAGVEIGDAFRHSFTGHPEKARAIDPVERFPIAVVDCASDRVIINTQPAVERKNDLEQIAAAYCAKLDLLFFGVGAVGADAVTISNQETDYRIVEIILDAGPHPDCQRLAGLDSFYPALRSVYQIRRQDLSAAIAMAVSVTQGSRTFVVDDCRFAGSRGRVLLKSRSRAMMIFW